MKEETETKVKCECNGCGKEAVPEAVRRALGADRAAARAERAGFFRQVPVPDPQWLITPAGPPPTAPQYAYARDTTTDTTTNGTWVGDMNIMLEKWAAENARRVQARQGPPPLRPLELDEVHREAGRVAEDDVPF